MLSVNGLRCIAEPTLIVGPEAPFVAQSILEINSYSAYEAALIRLLLGSCDVCDSFGTVSLKQRTNNLVLGTKKFNRVSAASVQSALAGLGIDVSILNKYLRGARRQQEFYRDILLECIEFFLRSKRKEHVVAFLHLYRMLERISFAFPVIYASRATDYKSAYDSLKSFFGEKSQGELRFFMKFQELSLDPAVLALPCRFDFSAISGDPGGVCYREMRRLVETNDLLSENVGVGFEIKYKAVVPFLINLRNRFFHFSSDHSGNISLCNVSSPDELFERVNSALFNWLSVVYLQILTVKLR